jgi:hypothetical protein
MRQYVLLAFAAIILAVVKPGAEAETASNAPQSARKGLPSAEGEIRSNYARLVRAFDQRDIRSFSHLVTPDYRIEFEGRRLGRRHALRETQRMLTVPQPFG